MVKIFTYIWQFIKAIYLPAGRQGSFGDLAQLVRVCDSQSQDKGSTPLISTIIIRCFLYINGL